jgi:hypothetical protein
MTDELAFTRWAGAFHIRNGQEIVVDPSPEVAPPMLRAVLLGKIMAYLLRQRGWLSLHASGVTIGGAGVLFLGRSGSGKSTTAAAFYSRGHAVITDDVAAVRLRGGECFGLTRQRLRLDENGRSIANSLPPGIREGNKFAFELAGLLPLSPSVRIDRIYALTDGPAVSIRLQSRLESVRLLSAHSLFRRRRMESSAVQNHLRDCTAVAQRIPVVELSRPNDLSALSAIVRLVEEDLAQANTKI